MCVIVACNGKRAKKIYTWSEGREWKQLEYTTKLLIKTFIGQNRTSERSNQVERQNCCKFFFSSSLCCCIIVDVVRLNCQWTRTYDRLEKYRTNRKIVLRTAIKGNIIDQRRYILWKHQQTKFQYKQQNIYFWHMKITFTQIIWLCVCVCMSFCLENNTRSSDSIQLNWLELAKIKIYS